MKTLHSINPKIAELMRKMRQTASRSLREAYAQQAKVLMRRAEKISDKNNPEEQAGLRKLRNEMIQILDTQFPISQRKEDLKELSEKDPLGAGTSCSLGIIEGDTIYQGLKWPLVLLLAALAFGIGRTTKKAYRRMKKHR
jgi:hypothetical protein